MIGAVQAAAADGHAFDAPQTVQELIEEWQPEKAGETPAILHEQERFPHQKAVYRFYHGDRIQIFVAAFIFVNFFMECLRRQIDPDPEDQKYTLLWGVLEWFFTLAFLIELLVNMYGSWTMGFPQFLKSAWNYFDMFVVAVGILLLCQDDLPGPLNFVKMCRAFRVFRLFGRIVSLKKILVSIERALPGVVNAFVIMLLVVCIYAVLAVDLYGRGYPLINPTTPEALTARNEKYDDEYYGNFAKSLYTLFQVLTGESWSEMGVRPLLFNSPDLTDNIVSAVFFVSFVVINGIILLNVVVAVLLDGMSTASDEHKEHAEQKTKPENGKASHEQQDETVQGVDLKQEVSTLKAQIVEVRLKLNEASALLCKDKTS